MNYHDDYTYENEEMIDISGGSTTGSGKRYKKEPKAPKNKKSKKKAVIIASSVAAAVIVIVGVAGFVLLQNGVIKNDLFAEPTEYVFRFDAGTVVSGVAIADKTVEEAKAALEENQSSFAKPLNLSIDLNGSITELTQDDFEYTYDIDAVLSTIQREETEAASAGKSLFEQETTVAREYTVTATVTKESIKAKTAEIEESTNKDAENAYVSEFSPYAKERFKYQEEADGCKLNTDDLTEKIAAVFESGKSESRIIADIEAVKADITIDDLKKNIVKLATYETVSYNTANGTSNMKVSLEACNGSVIEPGETWSFNECTGDSNLESNGYKSAHVISDGKLVDGIGGGICQSSSTIYNAAIRANMDVEERYNHKWASSYVPTGLDATIDYPNLDLKLSNPTKYPMFLECKVYDGTTLTATFWGYQPSDYDMITTYNEMTSKSSGSYTVKAWRIYYKDGKEVDRESLGSSTYDTENGYVFYSAENDSNAKGVDYDVIEPTTAPPTEPTQKATEKPTEKATEKPTEKPTQKPTEKPTEKPTDKATEKPTQPSTDKPATTPPQTTQPSTEPSETE